MAAFRAVNSPPLLVGNLQPAGQILVVGIVTGRDTRFETNLEQPVSNIMTGQDRLVTVRENASKEHIQAQVSEKGYITNKNSNVIT